MVRLLLLLLCMSCTVSPARSGHTDGAAERLDTELPPKVAVPEKVNLQEARFYAHRPQQDEAQEPLVLESFAVELVSAPGTLRTRIDVVVKNDSGQQKQGRIRLPIPSNAAITDAILFVGNKARKGAFVSKARAQQVYGAIVSTKRDPLLALWAGPNWLDLRVFPIPAKGTRRFQVEWVEPTLLSTAPHKLPVLAHQGVLVGPIDEVKLNGVVVDSSKGSVLLPEAAAQSVVARRIGEAIGHVLTVGYCAEPLALVLVVDTSANVLPAQRSQQRVALERILAKLPEDSRVTLVTADWLVQTIAEDQTPEQVRATLAALDSVTSTGAFDLKNTFKLAAEKAKEIDARSIVYLGSGTTRIGRGSVSGTIEMLQAAGISVFTSGAKVVSDLMMQVAWRTGGRHLREMKQFPAVLQFKQAEPVLAGVQSWLQLHTVGRFTYWLGRYVGDAPTDSKTGNSNDLAALWSRALVAQRSEAAQVPVLSPSTSILVLETDSDYRRWGIQNPKDGRSVELWTAGSVDGWGLGLHGVGGGGGGVGWGTAVGAGWGTIGSGSVGTIGSGVASGYGSYAVGSSRGPIVQTVKILKGNARGLDESLVRRYLRRKLPRIRHCYNKQLLVTHLLGGTMTLQFSISSAGRVEGATASGVAAPALESCVVVALQSIQFPKPKAQKAIAQYAILFSPTYQDAQTAQMGKALQRFNRLDKSVRAVELSKELGQRFESEEMLAWWLVQRFPSYVSRTATLLLATRLLHSAGNARDARRVLSLLAFDAPAYAVELYKELGYTDDAQRMSELLYAPRWGN